MESLLEKIKVSLITLQESQSMTGKLGLSGIKTRLKILEQFLLQEFSRIEKIKLIKEGQNGKH